MEKITVSKKFKINIADHRVQSLYKELNGTISSDRLSEVLDEIEKLPQLNKSAVRIRNKKGVLIALVGEKGSLKKFSIDYCNGCWYFDGNRIGKKKRLLVESFYNDSILEEHNLQNDEVEKIWKRIANKDRF